MCLQGCDPPRGWSGELPGRIVAPAPPHIGTTTRLTDGDQPDPPANRRYPRRPTPNRIDVNRGPWTWLRPGPQILCAWPVADREASAAPLARSALRERQDHIQCHQRH